MGACHIPLEKGFENTFSTVYYTPHKVYIFSDKTKKKNCSHMTIADHDGQKNHNRKMTTTFFAYFSTSEGALKGQESKVEDDKAIVVNFKVVQVAQMHLPLST